MMGPQEISALWPGEVQASASNRVLCQGLVGTTVSRVQTVASVLKYARHHAI
jgi:hypothetical protein